MRYKKTAALHCTALEADFVMAMYHVLTAISVDRRCSRAKKVPKILGQHVVDQKSKTVPKVPDEE